jgi:hypothetical protein
VLWVLAAAAPLSAADEAPAGPEAPVAELAAKGRFSDDLCGALLDLAEARAREALAPGAVSEEFWASLSASPTARRA